MATLLSGVIVCSTPLHALEFNPGVGAGVEYTDNATLAAENPQNDTIAVGHIGAQLSEYSGPVFADVNASLDHVRYTNDTFEDQRYLNLSASAGWEMIKQRFDWLLQNNFTQRTVNTLAADSPDNLQDSNSFSLAANMNYPVSSRHYVTLTPQYRNFYYESQNTDNQQFSLTAGWNYRMYRQLNVGLNTSIRSIDYKADGISSVRFLNTYLSIAYQRKHSNVNLNLGNTSVESDTGQKTDGFTGGLDWRLNTSEYSTLHAHLASDITDSSSTALVVTGTPGGAAALNLQVTTDVVKNRVMTLGYKRDGRSLSTDLQAELREIEYSESNNDQRINVLNASFGYDATSVINTRLYTRYRITEFIDLDRTDDRFVVGGSFTYKLSHDLRGTIDVRYRQKDSTNTAQNYDEVAVFANFVYGYGMIRRPSRAGGF